MKLFKFQAKTNRTGFYLFGEDGHWVVGLLAFLFVFTPFIQAQADGQTDLPKTNANYKIGVGDVLQVTVVKQSLLSLDGVRVSNEGTIRLPMLEDDIRAACLSEAELTSEVTKRYKKYLLNPQVYVAVREFNANPIALVGAVNAPGRFQLQRPMRLLELLTRVNGPSANAGKTIQIIRNSEAKNCGANTLKPADDPTVEEPAQEIISLPLAEVIKGNEAFNPFVESGDIIRVTEAQTEQAFLVGSVKTALTINLREPVTLTKAIAMAGGVAPGAKIERIKISRQLPDSLATTEIVVNLKDINKHLQDDILLQPNDIVDVPGASGTRKFLKDVFRTVIPVVTRVPVILP
jgi:polysaccharide export outer membrane protein